MNKEMSNIAVLLGGRSQEREISLMTGRAVVNSLKKQGYNVDVIDWQGRDSISQLLSVKYDCAFIALHGIDGEDGCVQSLLEILDIPYTGSGVLASALCMDKLKTKQILKSSNLPILADVKIDSTTDMDKLDIDKIVNKLGLPLCVKPVNQGSSIGTYKVEREQDLLKALLDARNYGEQVMVEPWVSAGEYTVGILDNKPLASIKIAASKQFYNYEAKYLSHDTKYTCPSGLVAEKEHEIQDLALKAFNAAGCSDWGRVDFVMDDKGDFYILEVNTVPGLTDTSLVPKAAKAQGLSFDDLVIKIMSNASLKQEAGLLLTKDNKASA